MKKIKSFLKKAFNIIFIDAPLLKVIISFLIGLIVLVIADRTNIYEIWFIGLIAFGYAFLNLLVATIFAFIINPIRNKKLKNKDGIN